MKNTTEQLVQENIKNNKEAMRARLEQIRGNESLNKKLIQLQHNENEECKMGALKKKR